MKKDGLLEIGEVVKTHGLKGRIRAKSYLVSKENAQRLGEVFVGRLKEPAVPFRIKALQAERKMLYLELEGIEDVDAAARLVGSKIFILPDTLAKLPEDEYYWHELLELEVRTETGGSRRSFRAQATISMSARAVSVKSCCRPSGR
jgi:16S rRNA processing protein RimM